MTSSPNCQHPVRLFALTIGLAALASCSDRFRSVADTAGEDGGSDADGDSDGDADGDSDADSDTGTVCDEQDFNIELIPPHMMILLDSSASMAEDAQSGGSKWDQAIPAIQNIVDSYSTSILFGFDTFPNDGTNCDVDDPVELDVVTDLLLNELMDPALSGASPNGASTPLYCAMDIMDEPGFAPNFMDPGAEKYLVIVSDGADLCGEECCVALIPWNHPECVATDDEFADLASDLYTLSGIRQVAIGFDAENVSEGQLNAIAENGGTEFDQFILATDQASLETALDDIAQTAVSCVYEIQEPVATADPNNVNFYFDGVVVPHDEGCAQGEGWDWTDETHTAIHFCEASCALLQTGLVDVISAMFGCPTVEIE